MSRYNPEFMKDLKKAHDKADDLKKAEAPKPATKPTVTPVETPKAPNNTDTISNNNRPHR